MDIQWYPGHMAKTKRVLKENLSLVDVVVELLDARIPYSSKNPDLDELARDKKRVIVLNKADLAEAAITKQWTQYFEEKGFEALPADSTSGKGLTDMVEAARRLMQEKIQRQKQRGRIFVPIRAMIVGIPNVGKSTLINQYTGRSITKTGDRPGVTRSTQWVRLKKDFELLDTPGILWPKFEDKDAGLRLAFTGAINDDILDSYTVSLKLIECLTRVKPKALTERYKIELGDEQEKPHDLLQKIAEARGFKRKGGEPDVERCAIILLDEYRGGKLGRISLERP